MWSSRSWCVLLLVLVGCAKEKPRENEVRVETEALRDVSSMPVGRGFDRALELERDDCFARDAAKATPVQLWEATGFTVFTENELGPKLASAIQVGVKVEQEKPLGASIGALIGPTGELPHFAMLARFTALREDAGPIRAPSAECTRVPSSSRNDAEDFVTACGDRYLAQKVFGAHVLITWRRSSTRPTVDELMATMFGARTVGATLDPLVNLASLSAQGLGKEEVFIEVLGAPFGPTAVTLPSGKSGFTVDAAHAYLVALARANVSSFPRVIDYSMVQFTVDDIDACLAQTGRRSQLPQSEWACIDGHLDQLADARDGEGTLAYLRDRYELHKLALTEQLPAGRVVFNTVPQSRCRIDADGDPDLEKSGPCQEQALADFVKFFEDCALRSSQTLTDCRNNELPNVMSCADFERAGCQPVQATLSDGTVVGCDEAGMNAALADVIPYQVRPPFTPQAPPTGFTPPLVLQFDEATSMSIPGVSPATDLCGITAVSGGLHGSAVIVEASGADWLVLNLPAFTDRRVSVEVTCVKFENFFYINGGSASAPVSRGLRSIPLLNGGHPYEQYLVDPGNPILNGYWDYLDEPATNIYLTNPDSTGFAKYVGYDLFPAISVRPVPTVFSITANPPRSGVEPGGSLSQVSAPGYSASVDLTTRSTAEMSARLPLDAFCYFVGLSGRYFNASDSARISTSDGFKTLTVSTPLSKDRNPGAKVQCVFFDRY